MMTSVVDQRHRPEGAASTGVQVAGKTGTAQNSGDRPRLVRRLRARPTTRRSPSPSSSSNGGATGGDISAPIARQVIQAYLARARWLMALTIGSLLAGRYEITAPIATGGMGEVWKARDRVLDRDRRGQGAARASTPATRASWPASATRPGTPPR